MKPFNSNWQNHNGQIHGGFSALEGTREPQFVDYANAEESYELLPSGD